LNRLHIFGLLVVIGAGSIAFGAYQQPAADAPKVIDVDKIKDNLFVLKGGGGNTAVFIMANGSQVGANFGGLAGRLQTLQQELR
jgi:hypothetical protein